MSNAKWMKEDLLDSRDLADRMEELEALDDKNRLSPSESDELEVLEKLQHDLENEGVSGWTDGIMLIEMGYFHSTYAEELIGEIYGDIEGEMLKKGFPYNLFNMDWDDVAEVLSSDYQVVRIGTQDYYAQSA